MDPAELAVSLERVDQRAKSNTHRIEDLETRQDSLEKLVTSVEVLATRQETVENDVKEIKTDVKALTEKPGKRWEGIVDKALWAVVGALVAWILAGATGI